MQPSSLSAARPLASSFGLALVLALTMALALSGCAHTESKSEGLPAGPMGSAGAELGQWRGKALLTDRQTQKSHTLNLDFLAQDPSLLRMEVTSQIGVYLASFVLNGKQMSYLLAKQHKFVKGPAEPKALQDLIMVPMDPHTILDVLFGRPLNSPWTCKAAADALPSCEFGHEQMSISWLEKSPTHARLVMVSSRAKIEMDLSRNANPATVTDKTFELEAPKGFQVETRP